MNLIVDELGTPINVGDSVIFRGWRIREGAVSKDGNFYDKDVIECIEIGLIQEINQDVIYVTTGERIYMPDPAQIIVANPEAIRLAVGATFSSSDCTGCRPPDIKKEQRV